MNYFATILLAFALSIDGFGAGIAYGIKKVKISMMPIIAITISSVLVMTLAVFAGQLIANIIPDRMEIYIGTGILIIIGIWQLIQGWKDYQLEKVANEIESPVVLITINLKTLGLVLQILRDPIKADLDKSGEISLKEAFLLGIALNVDAIGAGIAAGVAGYSMHIIPVVALSLFLSIVLGLYIGKKYANKFLGERAYVIPGLILIFLGTINLFK